MDSHQGPSWFQKTKERLAEDTKMKSTMAKSCATKAGEHKASQKLRQEELLCLVVAIHEYGVQSCFKYWLWQYV